MTAREDQEMTHSQHAVYDTVVIGAGQAGLAIGWHLKQQRQRFVLVDAGPTIGHTWRTRWDSLVLFTPAQYDSLPGMPFPAPADTYPTKEQAGDYLQTYAAAFDLPVQLNSRVTGLRRTGENFEVRTATSTLRAHQVVIATGPFAAPLVPQAARGLDEAIVRLHSSQYRNPADLPHGPVLVVGAGNSGMQIAAELATSRPVELAVGTQSPTLPQRVLGRDLFWWLTKTRLSKLSASSRLGRRLKSQETIIGTSRRQLRRAGVTIRPRLIDADGKPSGSPTAAARTSAASSGSPGSNPTTRGWTFPTSCTTARSSTSAASPTSPGCTFSAWPGSTPAARPCSASSGTTPPTSPTGSPPAVGDRSLPPEAMLADWTQ